jgi:hypothetical protein
MSELIGHLKPSEHEVIALALRETDAREAHRFEPICRGPLFAVVAIPAIVLLAIPSLVARALRGWLGRGPGAA